MRLIQNWSSKTLNIVSRIVIFVNCVDFEFRKLKKLDMILESMYKRFSDEPGVVPVCIGYFFVREMKTM